VENLTHDEGPDHDNPKTFKIKYFENSKSQEDRHHRVDKGDVENRDPPPMDTRSGRPKDIFVRAPSHYYYTSR
jgi:hypothetical protein